MNIKVRKNTFNYIVLAQKIINEIDKDSNKEIELYDLYTAVLLGLPTSIKINYLKHIQTFFKACEKENIEISNNDLYSILKEIEEEGYSNDIFNTNFSHFNKNENKIHSLYADIITKLMFPFYQEKLKNEEEAFYDICYENICDIHTFNIKKEDCDFIMNEEVIVHLVTPALEIIKQDKYKEIMKNEDYYIDNNFLAMSTLAAIDVFCYSFLIIDDDTNIDNHINLLKEHYEYILRPILEYFYTDYINDEMIERILRKIFNNPFTSYEIVSNKLKNDNIDSTLSNLLNSFGLISAKIDGTESLIMKKNNASKNSNEDIKLLGKLNLFMKENNFISDFAKDINVKEKSILCRDKEVKSIIISLSKKTKSNIILIGEPGVGKTAIVEELSRQIKNNEINRFKDYKILECNITSLVAGTMYRGMLEEKLDNLIQFLTTNKNLKAILFIDEIHKIIGAGDSKEGSMDISNMLKPILARENIKIIGATTTEEYKKFICKDKALMRRFDTVKIYEPKLEDVKEMISEKVNQLEKYHSVKIETEDIDYVIKTSEEEIHNRYFPDKALDVIDYCMAECVYDSNDKFDKKYVLNYIENLKNENKEPIGLV